MHSCGGSIAKFQQQVGDSTACCCGCSPSAARHILPWCIFTQQVHDMNTCSQALNSWGREDSKTSVLALGSK